MAFTLTSSAFENGAPIPREYTCDGSNISPPLAWSDVPSGAQTLLLCCSDPDAPGGTFYHWLAYNLPPDLTRLDEGFQSGMDDPRFAQATNDFGNPGYGGPCPPHGHRPHAYHFRLSALNGPIEGQGRGSTCQEILEAADTMEIGAAELVGYFGR